ncbi:hypothetical protein SBDP2_40004 [Syntrophobacter sp. SbD2]|nr:hypothetical protein SBDP2_40004 [Syntrophobacter sp. SbD2]
MPPVSAELIKPLPQGRHIHYSDKHYYMLYEKVTRNLCITFTQAGAFCPLKMIKRILKFERGLH